MAQFKYLSLEWAQEATQRLQRDLTPEKMKHLTSSMVTVYTNCPDGVDRSVYYLVVEGGMHSRESLMALLWPESPSKNAAVTLRGTLSRLRKSLAPGGDFLVSEGGRVGFDFEESYDLDLAWLDTAVRSDTSPGALIDILELDRGEFLAGFSLPDAPEFDTWAAIQREACQRQVLWAKPIADFFVLASSCSSAQS